MSPPELAGAALAVAAIPRDAGAPVFPTPWAARAFALAMALHARGVFGWGEWSEALGAAIAADGASDPADAEAYWRAWLSALETMLQRRRLARAADLAALQDAWRHAAEATPHGRPIDLAGGPRAPPRRCRSNH